MLIRIWYWQAFHCYYQQLTKYMFLHHYRRRKVQFSSAQGKLVNWSYFRILCFKTQFRERASMLTQSGRPKKDESFIIKEDNRDSEKSIQTGRPWLSKWAPKWVFLHTLSPQLDCSFSKFWIVHFHQLPTVHISLKTRLLWSMNHHSWQLSVIKTIFRIGFKAVHFRANAQFHPSRLSNLHLPRK